MNTSKILLALLLAALPVRAAQHTIGGDYVVNATNGIASGLTQAAAKTFQTIYTTTNAAITFAQSAYWSNNSAALRFNLTDLPVTATEDKCVITLVGQIGSQFTNVADTITWLGPWGVLNALTNTITLKWTGSALLAWQDPMYGVVTIAQWVANTDNFDASAYDVVRVSSDAARNLTGVVGRPGGQDLTIQNVGSFTITLKNNVTSTSSNRFLMAQDIALGANQNITLNYDLTSLKWRPKALASVTEANLLFSDNTTADATTSQHGLVLKGDGNTAHFYRGDNTWGTPGSASLFRAYGGFQSATNSITETNLFSFTLTGGTLSTNKSVQIHLSGQYFNNSGSSRTVQFRVYYGGVKILDGTSAGITTQASLRDAMVDINLYARNGSTAAQGADLRFYVSTATSPTTGYGNMNAASTFYQQGTVSSTADSTADQIVTVAVILSAAESTSYLICDNAWAKE